ncbi:MAG: DUF1499 domain-containing protein [Nevskiales bacterium]
MIFRGRRPGNLGVVNGRLADGPNKPNWVSSQTTDKKHAIAALGFEGDAKAAVERLRDTIDAMPRTRLIEGGGKYLYFEFSSALMGYVDDVEFYCDGEVIHVRSASRLGYSDLGANRKRIETIRAAFAG